MSDIEIKRGRGRPRKTEEPEVDYPSKIRFVRPYGFDDDDGQMHYWFKGQTEENATSIAIVIDRGCSDYEVVE